LIQTLSAGDHVVCGQNTYGGTFRLFDKVWRRHGIEFTFVDATSTDAVASAFTPKTKLVFVETPTNPLMQLTDIAAVSERARKRGILTVVDNTFMSPYFQRPLELGADVAFHSVTKYLNGPQRSRGRRAAAERRRAARPAPLPPERGRRRARAHGLLLGAPGHQDAGRAHAAPR
jgi:cystathionine beta-lyase/cystathionine gamma-synthase